MANHPQTICHVTLHHGEWPGEVHPNPRKTPSFRLCLDDFPTICSTIFFSDFPISILNAGCCFAASLNENSAPFAPLRPGQSDETGPGWQEFYQHTKPYNTYTHKHLYIYICIHIYIYICILYIFITTDTIVDIYKRASCI